MAKKSLHLVFIVLIASLLIASFWNSVPIIKDSVHAILNPTLGKLLDWNLNYGMFLLILIVTILTTLIQKYGTDQKTLKGIKDEQNRLKEERKKYKNDLKRAAEIDTQIMKSSFEMMQHTMNPIIYTGIPLVLLFRWFMDYFAPMPDFRFFGIFSWFWFYLVASIVLSSILRKIFRVH